ncbi:hypothetical protein VTH06DRAFT_1442 [Thermothelomyces fergusii]
MAPDDCALGMSSGLPASEMECVERRHRDAIDLLQYSELARLATAKTSGDVPALELHRNERRADMPRPTFLRCSAEYTPPLPWS